MVEFACSVVYITSYQYSKILWSSFSANLSGPWSGPYAFVTAEDLRVFPVDHNILLDSCLGLKSRITFLTWKVLDLFVNIQIITYNDME